MKDLTDSDESRVFPPRRAFSLTLIPAAVAGVFTAAGIAAWLYTGDSTTLFLPLTGLVLYALVFLTTAAVGYSYRIEKGKLILRNPFKGVVIDLRDIAAVYRFSPEEARAFLTELELPWVHAARSRDYSLWGRSVKRNTEILRFMSVPLVTSSRSMGSKTNVTHFKVLVRGEYLLIQTLDGVRRMITPRDTEGLYRFLIDSGSAVGLADRVIQEEKERTKDIEEERRDTFSTTFVRNYRIIAIGLTAFIVLVTFIGLVHPPEAPQEKDSTADQAVAKPTPGNLSTAGERPKAGWVDGNTLIVRVDSMYWPTEDQPVETRISLMREFGDLEAESAFARFIAEEYAQTRGITPADMEWDKVVQALKDWAGELAKERIHEDLGDRLRFGKFVYRFTSPGLRKEAETRFAGYEN